MCGENLVLVTKEVFEQSELATGQGQRCPADADLSCRGVKSKLATRQDVRSFRRSAPGQCPEAGEQFGEGEWLDQVVVCTDIEASDAVVDRIAGGQQQDRRPVARRAKFAAQTEPIAVGQHHVEHEDVVHGFCRQPSRVLDRSRRIDRIAVAAQATRDQAGEADVIFEQENLHQRQACGR